MITIRLLGGAKKAVGGKPLLNLDRASASVAEILQFLQSVSVEPRLLRRPNLIIAVNGVDSSALQGENTLAKAGDTVTVVTVVHGGAMENTSGIYVSIKGVRHIIQKDPGAFLDTLRRQHKGVSIQAVRADAVFGMDHIVGVLRIVLDAEKRKVMLASKAETEFLLRIACTRQISEAIKRVGIQQSNDGCFVAFSRDSEKLVRYEARLAEDFTIDNSVIDATARKKTLLTRLFRITAKVRGSELVNHLVERSAILAK